MVPDGINKMNMFHILFWSTSRPFLLFTSTGGPAPVEQLCKVWGEGINFLLQCSFHVLFVKRAINTRIRTFSDVKSLSVVICWLFVDIYGSVAFLVLLHIDIENPYKLSQHSLSISWTHKHRESHLSRRFVVSDSDDWS